MEDKDIISLWKTQNAKIERSLAINDLLLRETINLKAKSALEPLKRLKTLGIIAGMLWLIMLGHALFYAFTHYSAAGLYFMISASAIFMINLKAVSDYIRHLVMANDIDYNGSVTSIQQELSKLQLSIVQHARIMCIQLPFYTTFYLSSDWFPHSVGWGYIFFQVLLTGTFTFGAYWLYKNHTVENLDKKWMQRLIAGSGGKSVMEALKFYREVELFKQDNEKMPGRGI